MTQLIFKNFFSQQTSINQEDDYAVAVSGGPDSMALAHLLIEWTQAHHKKLHLVTVDHGLRAEAKDEAQMIADWVEGLGLEGVRHSILRWEGEKPDTAIMEAARAARYQLMASYCQENNIKTLFIAHHQDDQAETFLMRLSKGSGLDGLASMGALRSYDESLTLARPLLEVAKQDLISYCAEHHVPVVNDPSNENVDYLRPRLRASMAVLEKEGLSVKRLATTAKRLARVRTALEEITQKAFEDCLREKTEEGFSFDLRRWQKFPEEISLRVLQKALESLRPEAPYRVRMEKLEDLFQSLWLSPCSFKPRTLGGGLFSLKCDKGCQNASLWVEKENPKESLKEQQKEKG